jgi:2-polyprenyl-3-methyl-5-hydroxy-6-metoxy-1,4-benzoquinol methylase
MMAFFDPCRAFWINALRIPPRSLRETVLWELQTYYGIPRETVLPRCRTARRRIADAWRRAPPRRPEDVEAFYRQPLDYAFELLWWHSFGDRDRTFLSLLPAARLAHHRGARRALDFGGGVGSHALAMAALGLEVTLADVSGDLLGFAAWRAEIRGRRIRGRQLDGQMLDGSYDFIVAVDVLEHLPFPAETLVRLCQHLRPGGYLFLSMPAGFSADVPQHISAWGEQLVVDGGLRTVMRFSGDSMLMEKTGEVRAHGDPPRLSQPDLRSRRALIPSVSPGLWWQQTVRWYSARSPRPGTPRRSLLSRWSRPG